MPWTSGTTTHDAVISLAWCSGIVAGLYAAERSGFELPVILNSVDKRFCRNTPRGDEYVLY